MRAEIDQDAEAVGLMHLRLVDPARNCFRVYCLAESESLFGEPSLFIIWGRIGQRCRVRVEVFPDQKALRRRRSELLARRRRHGYQRIFWRGGFMAHLQAQKSAPIPAAKTLAHPKTERSRP